MPPRSFLRGYPITMPRYQTQTTQPNNSLVDALFILSSAVLLGSFDVLSAGDAVASKDASQLPTNLIHGPRSWDLSILCLEITQLN